MVTVSFQPVRNIGIFEGLDDIIPLKQNFTQEDYQENMPQYSTTQVSLINSF